MDDTSNAEDWQARAESAEATLSRMQAETERIEG